MGGELSVKPVRAITWTDVGGREASLIQRCAARDEDACAELVTEHQRMVYQLSLNLLNDHNEALDLSQEVFLRVFRTIHSFRGHSSLRTWIYRIVVNQARNRQRWWRRRHRAQQVSLDQHIQDHGELPETVRPRSRPAGRPEAARRAHPRRARSAAVRPEDGHRAARDRRPELRGDRVLAGHCRRHGEIASCARPRRAARAVEGRMTGLTCAAVRQRLAAFHDDELAGPGADRGPGAPERLRRVRRASCASYEAVSAALRLAAAPGPPTTGPGSRPG